MLRREFVLGVGTLAALSPGSVGAHRRRCGFAASPSWATLRQPRRQTSQSRSRLPTAGPRLGGPQRREGRPTPPLPYQLLHCAVKNVSSTLPFSPIKQTKRCDPVACFRSRYASPMITRRTGTSSIRVLAFETASDSISNERSFSAGRPLLQRKEARCPARLNGWIVRCLRVG